MKKYSSSKEVNQMIIDLIKSGWQVKTGKRHKAIISPRGQKITFSSTPSDFRVFKNFRSQIRNEIREVNEHAI